MLCYCALKKLPLNGEISESCGIAPTAVICQPVVTTQKTHYAYSKLIPTNGEFFRIIRVCCQYRWIVLVLPFLEVITPLANWYFYDYLL